MTPAHSALDVAAAGAEGDARPALVLGDRVVSWRELAGAALQLPPQRHFRPALDEASIVRILAHVHRRETIDPAGTGHRDPALLAIIQTSGSTAAPKHVLLSRRAFVAAAEASAANLGWREDDRWLLTLPPTHVGGLSVVIRALIARRAVALHSGPRDAASLHDAMVRTRATIASFVPTLLYRLVRLGRPAPPTLRAALVGGAVCAPRILREARELGYPVLPTYGMSETCAQVATRAPGDDRDAPDVGHPLGANEIRIENGEIVVGGPQLFDGYLDASARGPLRTGDLGRLDSAGRLVVHGRVDDVIISGGKNYSPAAIEAALIDRGAEDACVVGIPDPEWGHVLGALFVGPALAAEALPRGARWRTADALPVLPNGKVDREAARAQLLRR